MSLPPLPEVWGNYALKDFVEITAPERISWLPQTEGWLYLGILLLALAAWRGWLWLKHWHRNRYRREALRELEALQQDDGEALVAAINALLKRAALAAYPRPQVAPLHGEDWVAFLQGECGEPPFDGVSQQLLAQGSYRPQVLNAEVRDALVKACRVWLDRHRGVAA